MISPTFVNRGNETCRRCGHVGLHITHLVNIKTGEEDGHLWKCDECDLGHLFHDEGEFIAKGN